MKNTTNNLQLTEDLLARIRITLDQIEQETLKLQQSSYYWKIPMYTLAGATFILLLMTLKSILNSL